MPELPEVETTIRGLAPFLDGQRLTAVTTFRPDLRRPFPADLAQRLTGATVTGLSRRAKYGIVSTDRDDHMIFHLGMSGRWRIAPSEIEKHDHFILETEEATVLALNDARRFASLDLVETDDLANWPPFAALGPEPFDLDAHRLKAALAGRKAAIKLLLLDQRIVAGLGNIYACEALFRARISPKRLAGTLATKTGKATQKTKALVDSVKAVLEDAIKSGGSSLRDYKRADGSLGEFQHRFKVYGREGKPCARKGCGGTVRRIVQGGRSTFYCPTCQR